VPPDNKDSKGVTGGWQGALRDASPFIGIGTTMAASLALGVWGGHWLDAKLGTTPWLLLTGSVFGVAAGLYHLYITVKGQKKQ
jgi:hypothetical protein